VTWREEIELELTADEGERLRPYIDTKRKITIGRGRNLSDRGISKEESAFLFKNDVDAALHDCMTHLVFWRRMNQVRQKAMVNLMFNMGWPTLSTFTTFLRLMAEEKYVLAGHDLGNTLWATEVQQPRVNRILDQIIAGAEKAA
jgi:lysozyme